MILLILTIVFAAVSIVLAIYATEFNGKAGSWFFAFLTGIFFCSFMELCVIPKDNLIGSYKVSSVKYNEKDNNFRYYISGIRPIGYIQSDSLIYHKNDSLKVIFEKYTEKE